MGSKECSIMSIHQKLVEALTITDRIISKSRDMLSDAQKARHDIVMLMLTIPKEDEECQSKSEK